MSDLQPWAVIPCPECGGSGAAEYESATWGRQTGDCDTCSGLGHVRIRIELLNEYGGVR